VVKKEDFKDRDAELKQTVEEFLKKDKNLSGYDINVRVVKGKTTLQGVVDTLSEKNHARKVVESIEGVGEIENYLTVSTDGAVDDRHVYMEVRQELEGDPLLTDTRIKVLVNKGEVSLTGKAESLDMKQAAGEDAAKAMGVKRVINNIAVPELTETDDTGLIITIDDNDIVNEIRRIFAAEGIENGRLKVSAEDGVVSLEGDLSIEERNRAMAAAGKIPGVKNVHAYLVNTEKGELSRAARAAEEIKRSFEEDLRLTKIPLNIYEKEGHLVLEGTVSNTEEKRLFDEKLHSLLEEFGKELVVVENKIRLVEE
jgi:osmotically-inducible protein OsmY